MPMCDHEKIDYKAAQVQLGKVIDELKKLRGPPSGKKPRSVSDLLFRSFCAKVEKQVKALIAGPREY